MNVLFENIAIIPIILLGLGNLLFILACFYSDKKLTGICGISLILLGLLFLNNLVQAIFFLFISVLFCILFYFIIRIRIKSDKQHTEETEE